MVSISGSRNPVRAFTLIEVLIVLGILAVLVTLLVTGFKKMQSSSRARATTQMLASCNAVFVEFERTTQLKGITKSPVVAPARVDEGSPDRAGQAVKQTRQIMALVRGIPSNKTVIDQLPPEHVWPGQGGEGPVILDAWRNPIIFVPSGGLEQVMTGGKAQSVKSIDDRPFFASAGPDGDFKKGDDNIYSTTTVAAPPAPPTP